MTNLLSRQSTKKAYQTPLLFVHGQWFGGWCWVENYFTFFNDRGFDTHAIDLGQRSLMPFTGVGRYIDELAEAIAQMPAAPLLIGHGSGANLILRYIAAKPKTVSGACLLAPLPNKSELWNGNFQKQHKLTSRLLFNLGLGKLLHNYEIGQAALFTDNLPKVQRRHYPYYLSQLQNYSPRVVDVLTQQQICGNYFNIPLAVIGASRDTIVRPEAITRMADTLGVDPVFIDTAHAMMLDVNWHKASNAINTWISNLGVA